MMSNSKSNLKRFGIWFLIIQITLISFISDVALSVNAANTSVPSIDLTSNKIGWTNEDVTITSKTKGSYVQEESKEVTAQSSPDYNSGGFSGELDKYVQSGTFVPAENKEVTAQTSPNYNSGGFSGTLVKYVHSGAFVPEASRMENSTVSSLTNSFPATQSYNSGGFVGTLSKNGTSTQRVKSGEYTPQQSGTVTGVEVEHAEQHEIKETFFYNDGTWSGSLTKQGQRLNQQLVKGVEFNILSSSDALETTPISDYAYLFTPSEIIRILGQNFTNPHVTELKWSGPMLIQDTVSQGVTYTHTRPLTATLNYNGHVGLYGGNVTKQATDTRVYEYSQNYSGVVTKASTDNRVYRYQGTVVKPEVDTRVYRYRGQVVKPGYNNEITTEKWAKGSQSRAYFGVNGNNLVGESFTVSENGIYTVYAKDSTGKESIETISVNIDKTKPTLEISPVSDREPHEDVIINAQAKDNLSGVKSITLPDGTITTNNLFQYVMTHNGKHSFIIEDNAGNIRTEVYEISSIERTLDFSAPHVESGFEIKIQPDMEKDLHIGNMTIRDWRENNQNNWKLSLEASNLKSNTHTLRSGVMSFDGIENLSKLDGDKEGSLSHMSQNEIIDDGRVEIISADSERGAYVVSFKVNALKFNFPTNEIRKGIYDTKLTWTLESTPEIE